MSFPEYLARQSDRLVGLAIEHLVLVGVSVVIATVLGMALGVLTYQTERPRHLVLAVTGTILTIPSFALFGLMIPLLGLGATPAVVALVLYALLPIVRNTITGLRGVDSAVLEAARGMGMPRWRRLRRIELPLAWPVVLTGIRVATVILVGIAAIAAVINGPGLGKDIFRALARVGTPTAVPQVLAATVGIVLVALLLDAFYLLLGKLTTSRGIRD
jgi:osmoprotectant transport system permease protein